MSLGTLTLVSYQIMRSSELPTEVAWPRALVFLIHTPSESVRSGVLARPALLVESL